MADIVSQVRWYRAGERVGGAKWTWRENSERVLDSTELTGVCVSVRQVTGGRLGRHEEKKILYNTTTLCTCHCKNILEFTSLKCFYCSFKPLMLNQRCYWFIF